MIKIRHVYACRDKDRTSGRLKSFRLSFDLNLLRIRLVDCFWKYLELLLVENLQLNALKTSFTVSAQFTYSN